MRKKAKVREAWVVYKMATGRRLDGGNAVCEQAEWDEMERSCPGYYVLIREGITNEPEAERVARESPGGTVAVGRIHLKAR